MRPDGAAPPPDGDVPRHVLDSFGVIGADIEVLSGGRTNRTLRVRAGRDLVIQHLRATPKTDLLGVMENLVRVTAHLDWTHHMASFGAERRPDTWWPLLVPTTANRPYLMTDDGDIWRAYVYREGRIARHRLPAATLRSAARLFGRFSRCTFDLGGPQLVATAPGFHDLDLVWAGFEALCEAPERADVLGDIEPHLDELVAARHRLEQRCGADGLADVRARVVHNDTKLSNVLLHPTEGRAVAVLDLDLAMMGPLWHDVGDLVRSAAWNTGGASPELSVADTVELLAAFVDGAEDTVDGAEIATFAVAGARLSHELGIRYLSDHLRAVPVLRVADAQGSLGRGLANVKLATEMLNAYDALRSEVDAIIAGR